MALRSRPRIFRRRMRDTVSSSHPSKPRDLLVLFACSLALLLPWLPAQGQQPAPGGAGGGSVERLASLGAEQYDREDPVQALATWREVRELAPTRLDALLGLGNTHLMLGRSKTAEAYAHAVLGLDPNDCAAMALSVRSLIRGRQFDGAVRAAATFVVRAPAPTAELLAARASALFRVQRIDDAASGYRATLLLDPDVAEAHLRLGSGLLPPQTLTIVPGLTLAVRHAQQGDFTGAAALLRTVLQEQPDHAVAHRLLGEVMLQQKARDCMAMNEPCFQRLRRLQPAPDLRLLPAADFLDGYQTLSPTRRAVADRALALFSSRLPTLVQSGAHHDLLRELERTTDALGRSSLRGKRTFDGRVWDDVRGIGGLRAATGIEALDEAECFGFDTLAHEVAHQVHYYALDAGARSRITRLYRQARDGGRFLDYYAASNEAEYFGQGVEAFAALCKRPGCETTHGHTRFELFRRDPALHDFIAGLVDYDPLQRGPGRGPLLAAAVETALRSGRPEDAVVAAEWLDEGPYKRRVLAECRLAAAQAGGF